MNPLYINALIGGAIIGLSALLFIGGLGRVMGVSGIVKGIFGKLAKNEYWRYYFLVGLMGGVALYSYIVPSYHISNTNPSYIIAIIAGVLVGVGTSMANGCTSGHAVCGIGRLSIRSMIATLVFVASGMIAVYFTHFFS
ncbi:YeeE/YedE family protein [Candidatus Gracilibacteria bacterium]|nr:YeeE/YedE family protein [Candidatus Gracilibacteria bacterium]